MTPPRLLGLLLAIVALVVAGCGDDGAAPPPDDDRRVALESIQTTRLFTSDRQLREIRANIEGEGVARDAWSRLRGEAETALTGSPAPPPESLEYPRQAREMYEAGLRDGHAARNLALAYALTGEVRYAEKAREYVMAWATSYEPPADSGHYVFEPVGPVIKLLMAYDLIARSPAMDEEDRQSVRSWAASFVEKARNQVARAYNDPWVPEAPWGNGAAWARALLVFSAAVAGDDEAIRWAVESNEMDDGRPYTFETMLERSMDTDGRMVEQDLRHSVGYAMYTLAPLTLIAEVMRHRGVDLYRLRARNGNSLRRGWEYLVQYVDGSRPFPYDEPPESWLKDRSQHLPENFEAFGPIEAVLSETRAMMEFPLARTGSPVLRRAVNAGDDRGAHYDKHITGYAALFAGLRS